MPVNRSLAALQAFAYLVHCEGGLIRQDPDSIEPSSRIMAQPISVGKLALPSPDASRSTTAIRDRWTTGSFVVALVGGNSCSLSIDAGLCQFDVRIQDVDAEKSPVEPHSHYAGRARTDEWIAHEVTRLSEQLDKEFGQLLGEGRRVTDVRTFRGEMQHIGRVDKVPADPLGYVFGERATGHGRVSNVIDF